MTTQGLIERAKELVEPSPFQVVKLYGGLDDAPARGILWPCRWMILRCPCGYDFDLLFNLCSGLAVLCPKCGHEGFVTEKP